MGPPYLLNLTNLYRYGLSKLQFSTWWWIMPISKQEVSAPISCSVTFVPAESPILPVRSCCVLTPVNIIPKFPNEKSEVSLRFIIEIQQFLCVCMYSYKKTQGFLWKLCWLKNWRMWGFTPKSTNGGMIFCLESGIMLYKNLSRVSSYHRKWKLFKCIIKSSKWMKSSGDVLRNDWLFTRRTVYPQSNRLMGLGFYRLLAIVQVLPASNQPTPRRPAQAPRGTYTVTLKEGRSSVDSPHKWPTADKYSGTKEKTVVIWKIAYWKDSVCILKRDPEDELGSILVNENIWIGHNSSWLLLLGVFWI